MMRVLLILCFATFSLNAFGQQSINILCSDFTLNEESWGVGKKLRKVFESVLSNLENPPALVEREKLSMLLERIQEEKNLSKDFGSVNLTKLQAANVDFLIVGNFSKSLVSESYEFYAECIKISGQNALSKTVFTTLRFRENDLINTSIFENEVRGMLEKYSFIKGIGILENQQYKEIVRRLDEKDEQILELKKLVDATKAKEDSIWQLKNTAPKVDFDLVFKDSNLVIVIKFLNNVPIKMKPYLQAVWDSTMTDYKDKVSNIIHLIPIEIYPQKTQDYTHYFIYDTLRGKGKLPNDRIIGFRMIVKYSSIFTSEINKPELQEKEIFIDRAIFPGTSGLIPITVVDQ